MELIIKISALILFFTGFVNLGFSDELRVYILLIAWGLLISVVDSKPKDIQTWFIGLFSGFALHSAFLDYKGYEWVSDIENWTNTSALTTVVLIIFINLVFLVVRRKRNEEE